MAKWSGRYLVMMFKNGRQSYIHVSYRGVYVQALSLQTQKLPIKYRVPTAMIGRLGVSVVGSTDRFDTQRSLMEARWL